MAGNEKFKSSFKKMLNQHLDAKARHKEAAEKNADELELYNLQNEESALLSKSQLFMKKFMRLIPDEKRDEVQAKMEEIYKTIFKDEKTFQLKKKFVKNDDVEYPTKDDKDHFLMVKMPDAVYERGMAESLFDVAMEYFDDKNLDYLADEIDNYKMPTVENLPVYPLEDAVEKFKKKNETKITNEEKRAELNAELDAVARLVVTSSKEYSTAHGDSVETSICKKINARLDEINNAQLKGEAGHIAHYFVEREKNNGVREIKADYESNVNINNDFRSVKTTFTLPEDKKAAVRNILSFMKECGMFDYNKQMGEQGNKSYSFYQIQVANEKLTRLVESGSTDIEAYRAARAEYEQSLENMRKLYKMIEEQINPTNDMMVGNISSFRESWIPNEFKNSLILNSYANSLYNLGTVMNNLDVSVDDLVDNPTETMFGMIEKLAHKASPDGILSAMPFADAVFAAIEEPETKGYPPLAVGRCSELMLQLGWGSEYYENNALSAMLVSSFEGHAARLTTNAMDSSLRGYCQTMISQTIANMFLVNEEDRDYNKLRCFEAVSCDGKSKIPPFNAMEYCENHLINPDGLLERLHSTISAISEKGNDNYTGIAMRAAQFAAQEYLTVHPAPDMDQPAAEDRAPSFLSNETYKALKLIAESPMKAFQSSMSNGIKKEFKQFRSNRAMSRYIAGEGKEAMTTARASARAAERKHADAVKAIVNGGLGEAEKNAALSKLRAEEIKRLEAAYVDGKLPSDYFEQRRFNLEQGKDEEVVPFGLSERPTFKQFSEGFKNDLASGELTAEAVRLLYDRMMDNARIAERKFNLTAAEMLPKPTLEPTVEVEQVEDPRESIDVSNDVNDKHEEILKEKIHENPQIGAIVHQQ